MPKFTYSGDGRYYPDLALTVVDGDVVEFDEAAPDDGRWSLTASERPPAPPAPEKPETTTDDDSTGSK